MCLFRNHTFRNSEHGCQLQRRRMIPNPYTILSFRDIPCMKLFRETGHLFLLYSNGNLLSLFRLQNRRLCKSCQPVILLRLPIPGHRQVDLHNLSSGITVSGIFHQHVYLNPWFFHLQTCKFHFKRGIRKTISKRKQGLYPEAVKIAVSHINPFCIFLCLQISIQITEFLSTRVVFVTSCPRSSQSSSRCRLAEQYICDCTPALLSRLGNI